ARCLRKDLERRAQSMADLRVALEELREESSSGKLKMPQPAVGGVSRRSTPWFAGVLAAVLLGAAFFFWRATGGRSGTELSLAPVPLTTYPGNEGHPDFSPDGNQVVFTWDGERGDNTDIYVKLIDSGAPLRLTTDPLPDFGPKWSPDGRNIAFLRRVA